MAESLPPFLFPLATEDAQDIPCQNAQFIHGQSLGSSHALWWAPHSPDQEVDQVLLFIPGNPGLVEFYIPFLSEIHAKYSRSNLAIVAHAHLDHYPGIQNDPGRYSPDDSLTIQVQTSLEVLDAIISCYSKKPSIVLVGHSIGSWIILQLMKARPNDVNAAFLLFPTISNIGATPKGRLLTPIFAPIPRKIISTLAILASFIPDYIFAKLFSHWPHHQLIVLRDFIASSTCITAAFAMAHEEMKTVREVDMAFLEKSRAKLWFYYGLQDAWVGEEKQAFLNAFDPRADSNQVLHGPSEVPHAFCINHGDLLAKQCCEWLIAVRSLAGQPL